MASGSQCHSKAEVHVGGTVHRRDNTSPEKCVGAKMCWRDRAFAGKSVGRKVRRLDGALVKGCVGRKVLDERMQLRGVSGKVSRRESE